MEGVIHSKDEGVNMLSPYIGVTFAGGSCLINMGNQTLDLKGYLDENEEDVLVVDV